MSMTPVPLRAFARFAALAALLSPITASAAELAPEDLAFFETHIRPVLAEHCYSCHATDAKHVRGGLVVDSREGLLAGGDSGPSLVPGKPGESLLMEALRHESYEMPPSGKLDDAVIGRFEEWIARGAPDPRVGGRSFERETIDVEAARDFWAFQPVTKPKLPAVADASWPETPIDRFVLARLEAEGIPPAADVDRLSLFQRLHFDLIGLPPTPAEIEAFLADERPDALARVVDRLLDRPEFGERFGRHWLDIARYADSSGGGRTLLFPDAWRYRDFVVDAFRRDLPYDDFVRWQVAGDLLPHDDWEDRAQKITALGFLALGPINYELQDKPLLRMEIVDEQLDTLGRATMGMTIGCARCHDHMFDPIPTKDYYALAGIFRSTKSLVPGNVGRFEELELPLPPEQAKQLADHRRAVAEVEKELASARRRLEKAGGAPDLTPKVGDLVGIVADDEQAEFVGGWRKSTYTKAYVGSGYSTTLHAAAGEPENTATFTLRVPEDGEYEVRLAYAPEANRATRAPITVVHAGGEHRVRLDQTEPGEIDGLFTVLGRFPLAADKPVQVRLGTKDAGGYVIADAVQLLTPAEVVELEQAAGSPKQLARLEAARERVGELESRLAALSKSAPPKPGQVMAVREQPADERGDTYVHIRGNLRNEGEVVPRGFLSVIDTPTPEISEGESGRKQLAEWLTRPDHPLTSRVFVNRVWAKLLGRGIVATPDNFGSMGESPSHPELLDYLASRFVEEGWSTKRLVRSIVLSRVYRLGPAPSDAVRQADPENRYFGRQDPRRLDAEVLYDRLLVTSGRLERTLGGPSMAAGTRTSFGYDFGQHDGRRALYMPLFRNTLPPMLMVFDVADPNVVAGHRQPSTRPTQALYLMNSPAVIEKAEHAAKELLAQSAEQSTGERVREAYLRALGRPPLDAERDAAVDFLAAAPDDVGAWAGLFHALYASVDFRYRP